MACEPFYGTNLQLPENSKKKRNSMYDHNGITKAHLYKKSLGLNKSSQICIVSKFAFRAKQSGIVTLLFLLSQILYHQS